MESLDLKHDGDEGPSTLRMSKIGFTGLGDPFNDSCTHNDFCLKTTRFGEDKIYKEDYVGQNCI